MLDILTIHRSKGLEYDNVLIVSSGDTFFNTKELMEEDKNLLYVGITRTRVNLQCLYLDGILNFN